MVDAGLIDEVRIGASLAKASVRARVGGTRQIMMRAAGSLLVVLTEVTGMYILIGRFDTLGGWTAAQVAWLMGVASAGLGLGLVLGDSFEPPAFSNLIREGRIDAALTRPVTPLTWVMTQDVQVKEAGRVVGGLGAIGWASVYAPVEVNPLNVVLTLLAVACTAAMVFSILVIAAAFTMYTIEGSELANAFTYGGATMTGYPLQIYHSAMRAIFLWVIPLGTAVYVPALTVLDLEGPAGVPRSLVLAAPAVAVAFAWVASRAWRRGLRHYEGTGS